MVQDGSGTLTIQSVFSAGDWSPTWMTILKLAMWCKMASNWDITGYELNHWWLTKDVPSFVFAHPGITSSKTCGWAKGGDATGIRLYLWSLGMIWIHEMGISNSNNQYIEMGCIVVFVSELMRPRLLLLPGCLGKYSEYVCITMYIYIYVSIPWNNHPGMLWNLINFHLLGLNCLYIVYTGCYVSIPGWLYMDTLLYMYDIYFIWYTCVDEYTIHGLIGEVTFGSLSLGKSLMVRFYTSIVDYYQRTRVGIWVRKCILQYQDMPKPEICGKNAEDKCGTSVWAFILGS